jgi:hypothetical protein
LSGPDGRFSIDAVEADKYYLVISPYKDASERRFPKLYYPGVTKAADAKVLVVEFGESLSNLNFVVTLTNSDAKYEISIINPTHTEQVGKGGKRRMRNLTKAKLSAPPLSCASLTLINLVRF